MKFTKGQYSIGFAFVMGLAIIVVCGLLYIVFSQVFSYHLLPTVWNLANQTGSNMTQLGTDWAKSDAFWNTVPYILFFGVVLMIMLVAIRKEERIE